jgi:hypothetical protein
MPEEIAWMLAQRHRPLAVGQALSAILQAVDADSIVKSCIDRLIWPAPLLPFPITLFPHHATLF